MISAVCTAWLQEPAKVYVRLGKTQIPEEVSRKTFVIVLAGVNQAVLDLGKLLPFPILQRIDDGRDFHEVGARPHYAQKSDHPQTPAAIAPAGGSTLNLVAAMTSDNMALDSNVEGLIAQITV